MPPGYQVEEPLRKLQETVGKLSFQQKLETIENSISQIVRERDRKWHMPMARNVNLMFGKPLNDKEIEVIVRKEIANYKEADFAGAKPLIGGRAVRDASKRARKLGGYLIKGILPRKGCTLVAGKPKVGKTSSLVSILTRLLAGAEPAEGLRGRPFNKLIIFSDDQAAERTGAYADGAVEGLPDPDAAWEVIGDRLEIYNSLILNEDGVERLTALAQNNPGSVFIIDSLASTAGRLGVDENTADAAGIIYTMREAIESVDPEASTIIIHHTKKGDSGAQDSFRGSSAIPGAVDHNLLISRPTKVSGSQKVEEDMTPDRIFHLWGRDVGETKTVLRMHFNRVEEFITDEWGDDEVIEYLKDVDVKHMGSLSEYEKLKAEEPATDPQIRRNVISQTAFNLYQKIKEAGSKGIDQSSFVSASLSKVNVSKALGQLEEFPPLIKKEKVGRSNVIYIHPDAERNIDAPVQNGGAEYDF